MSDEKLRGAGHRSFLHHDSYQALWQRELLGLATTTAGNNNSSSSSGDAVRLTSVRHRREDSDDIRSDSSSSSDTNPCHHEDTEDSDASSNTQSGAGSDQAFCGGSMVDGWSVLLMNQAVS